MTKNFNVLLFKGNNIFYFFMNSLKIKLYEKNSTSIELSCHLVINIWCINLKAKFSFYIFHFINKPLTWF